MSLYRGFIPLNGKRAIMNFKDKETSDLLTLEEAKEFKSYGGVLTTDTVLVDIDDAEQSEILFNVVKELKLQCKVYKTTRGCHFLFKTDTPIPNKTHTKIAIGLTADFKGGGRDSYQALKVNGVEREVIYDATTYQIIPKFLTPVKTNVNLLDMVEGDGRNNTLFGYVLPLQQNGFTVEECRECIRIINDFVLKESLPENELDVILRDGAFNKPQFFNSKHQFFFDKFARYFF